MTASVPSRTTCPAQSGRHGARVQPPTPTRPKKNTPRRSLSPDSLSDSLSPNSPIPRFPIPDSAPWRQSDSHAECPLVACAQCVCRAPFHACMERHPSTQCTLPLKGPVRTCRTAATTFLLLLLLLLLLHHHHHHHQLPLLLLPTTTDDNSPAGCTLGRATDQRKKWGGSNPPSLPAQRHPPLQTQWNVSHPKTRESPQAKLRGRAGWGFQFQTRPIIAPRFSPVLCFVRVAPACLPPSLPPALRSPCPAPPCRGWGGVGWPSVVTFFLKE